MTVQTIISVTAGVCSVLLGGIGTFFLAKIKTAIRREHALSEGVQSLLRSEIIGYHEKYTERGFCPIYAKEAARRCYEAYHNLGGNGVVTKLYNDIMALPETRKEK